MYQTKLMIDNKEKRQFSRLRAHLGIMDADSPHRVKGIITLHPESITMLNNTTGSQSLLIDNRGYVVP